MDLEQKLAAGVSAPSAAFSELGVAPEMRSATMEAEISGDKFVGYAAVYDEIADIGDWTEESVRGSFRKVLSVQKQPVPFYYDHNDMHGPMAHTGGEQPTMRLSDDTKGLHVEVPNLPKHHPHVAMLREQIERGEVRHMSYGFVAGRGNSKIENRGSEKPHRIITGYTALLDVSPTWRPAFSGTTAELRHALLGMIPDLSQRTDRGAHQQPDGGATQDPSLDVELVEEDTEATVDSEQEQRSGAEAALAAAAARSRRLQMLGLALPRDI
jgi:HK97 family phage prohead protease